MERATSSLRYRDPRDLSPWFICMRTNPSQGSYPSAFHPWLGVFGFRPKLENLSGRNWWKSGGGNTNADDTWGEAIDNLLAKRQRNRDSRLETGSSAAPSKSAEQATLLSNGKCISLPSKIQGDNLWPSDISQPENAIWDTKNVVNFWEEGEMSEAFLPSFSSSFSFGNC